MELQQQIDSGKIIATKVFGPYQTSRMRMSKLETLNHLVHALSHRGSIDYLDVGLFERFHKSFKGRYRKLSTKWETVTAELLMKGPSVDCTASSLQKQKFSRIRNLSSQECVSTGYAVFVLLGKPCSSPHLIEAKQWNIEMKKCGFSNCTTLDHL